MTIIVKIEPTVRAGDHTSHFVAVFHFDGKNFVDSGKRLHVGVNGIPNQVGEEPLYSEGRAVLLVEGWSDGSMESGERCPDIIPLIDRYKKPDSKPVSGEVAEAVAYWETRVETYGFCKRDMDTLKVILQAAQSHHPAEDSKPQEVSVEDIAKACIKDWCADYFRMVLLAFEHAAELYPNGVKIVKDKA